MLLAIISKYGHLIKAVCGPTSNLILITTNIISQLRHGHVARFNYCLNWITVATISMWAKNTKTAVFEQGTFRPMASNYCGDNSTNHLVTIFGSITLYWQNNRCSPINPRPCNLENILPKQPFSKMLNYVVVNTENTRTAISVAFNVWNPAPLDNKSAVNLMPWDYIFHKKWINLHNTLWVLAKSQKSKVNLLGLNVQFSNNCS